MAKMHFKYASMNAGKSIDLIRTAYNYEESNGSYQYTSKTLNSPLTYTLYGKIHWILLWDQ